MESGKRNPEVKEFQLLPTTATEFTTGCDVVVTTQYLQKTAFYSNTYIAMTTTLGIYNHLFLKIFYLQEYEQFCFQKGISFLPFPFKQKRFTWNMKTLAVFKLRHIKLTGLTANVHQSVVEHLSLFPSSSGWWSGMITSCFTGKRTSEKSATALNLQTPETLLFHVTIMVLTDNYQFNIYYPYAPLYVYCKHN